MEFLRGTGSSVDRHFDRAIPQQELATTDVVVLDHDSDLDQLAQLTRLRTVEP